MKKFLSTAGFIDPVSLITLGILVVGLIVTTAIVKNPDISLDIRNWAKPTKTGNTAFDKCREESGRERCNERLGVNVNWKGEDKTVYEQPVAQSAAQPAAQIVQAPPKTCDANGVQYSPGAVVLYGGIGSNAKCGSDGRWETYKGPITDVTVRENVPEYAKEEYDEAVEAVEVEKQHKLEIAKEASKGENEAIEKPYVEEKTQQQQQPVAPAPPQPAPTLASNTTMEEFRCGERGGDWKNGQCQSPGSTLTPKPAVATPKPATNPLSKETKPKYASKSECEASTAPNTGAFRACGQYASQEENKTAVFNSLNTISFGAFENYTDSFSPNQVKKYWETRYNSREECQNDFSGRAKGYCDQIDYTPEQLSSSVKLGSIITAQGALAVTGTGYAGGVITGASTLAKGLAISTVYQTGQATSSCIDDPSSSRCKEDATWAAISWANVGTLANLTKAMATGVSQTINTARNINTGVNVVNIAADVYEVKRTCTGEEAIRGGCALSVGATLLDVGGGILDIGDIVKNINRPKIDIPDPAGTRMVIASDLAQPLPPINQVDNLPYERFKAIMNDPNTSPLSYPSTELDNALASVDNNFVKNLPSDFQAGPNKELDFKINNPPPLTGLTKVQEQIKNIFGGKGTNFGDDALLTVGGGTYKSLGGQKLVIDPNKDASLQKYLITAKEYLNQNRTSVSISRVDLLNEFVYKSIRYANPETPWTGPTSLRNDIYNQGTPAYLGQFTDYKTGVCREKAACMHVLLADNGKSSYMTIGDVDSVEGVSVNQEGGRHAWVEYIDTKTNQWMVADPTVGFVLPRDEAYNSKYVNVKNVKHEVFVWPEGTPLWQRLTKKITAN